MTFAACAECGNDDPTEGSIYCLDCLETGLFDNDPDAYTPPVSRNVIVLDLDLEPEDLGHVFALLSGDPPGLRRLGLVGIHAVTGDVAEAVLGVLKMGRRE